MSENGISNYADTSFSGRTLSETIESINAAPQSIKAKLDEHVIGLEDAKVKLAVALSMHFNLLKNVQHQSHNKPNVLITGNTGTGKTHLIKSAAKIFDVPFVEVDASSLTQSGYEGQSVDSILVRLYEKSGSIELAEHGIVYIDEIDKLASGDKSGISTTNVQESLLKMIEGCQTTIEIKKHNNHQLIEINTHNILFICGGAFSGIENINSKKNTIGFHVADQTTPEKPLNSNLKLIEYGLIPEFLGRFSVRIDLNNTSKAHLFDILCNSKQSALKEYELLFSANGVDLIFSECFKKAVVEEALEMGTGARALTTIINDTMMPIYYEFIGCDSSSNETKILTINKPVKENKITPVPTVTLQNNDAYNSKYQVAS